MTTTKKNPLAILVITSILIFISVLVWKKLHVDNSEEITPTAAKIEKPIKSKFRKKTNHPSTSKQQQEAVEEVVKEKYEPIVVTEAMIQEGRKSYSFHVRLSQLQTPEQLVEALLKYENSGEADKASKVMDKLLLLYPDYELPDNY